MIALFQLVRFKNLIIIALFQCLIRYGLIIPVLNNFGYEPVLSHFRFGLLVLASMLLAASGYVINDYFDVKIDRLNRPERVVIDNEFGRRDAMFFHVLLTFIGVFIGLFLSYVTRKESWALMFLFIPVFLWYYSTTFKKQGFIGNLVVSALTALVGILVVSLEFGALERVHGQEIINSQACSMAWYWTLGFAFFSFITTLIREIVKDLEDMHGDKEEGCSTLPVVIGVKYSKILVVLISSFTLISIWILYFYIDFLNSNTITLYYLIALITVPFIVSLLMLFKANTPKAYHKISLMLKLIMLMGILYIIVISKLLQ
ncbi:geranylgeranylglycerol-phosphate geranylgeranyltransferase [Plebeiibacterium marinum]|uniref:Geranylgeranylglycerol-phosphate geranylgeranyltransferase n=1 Tax=Plebeiibacterium marinum TaxID=2992111 RepID=A0AAE3SKV2_9BACT|nr:geranylgeranylglycerol-phosphate geranylgeranyltransferase [Plebeiobacterium marinum]MCW3805915.1 geranylgeranylglycerol-phosphate geranylgeranyltransferase [Plebeiobacterium marinum]